MTNAAGALGVGGGDCDSVDRARAANLALEVRTHGQQFLRRNDAVHHHEPVVMERTELRSSERA